MSDDLGRRSRRPSQCRFRRTGQGAWMTETGAKLNWHVSFTASYSTAQHVLPFRFTVDLRFCERTERNDGDPFASGILDRLAHQSLADLAAAQGRGNFCVVDDDQPFAGPTIGHLGFDAIDDHPVAPLRWAVFPLDCFSAR